MFAAVCVSDFALQAVLRHERELRRRPVALVDSAVTHAAKGVVLQCTAAARHGGVCPGLTAPQAMARCRDLQLKPCSPQAERAATDVLLQTACAFSPHIESTAPGVCTIDLRGLREVRSPPNAECEVRSAECGVRNENEACVEAGQQSFRLFAKSHFRLVAHDLPVVRGRAATRPHQSEITFGRDDSALVEWCGRLIEALAQCDLDAQMGVAATPGLALIAARAAKPVLVVHDTAAFFAALPIERLDPPLPVLDILKRWGIHRVAAFLALGKDRIAERLGPAALALFEQVACDAIRPLNIITPSESFSEQTEFEIEIEALEPLLFVLRRFIEQLVRRIELTYLVVAELELRLGLSSGAVYAHAFKVPVPTANIDTLFRMLHTHLEMLRTDAPITSLRLGARPCRASKQQFDLFQSALRDPNHFHETLARLTALLGADRVGTPVAEATHRPDAIRMAVPQFDAGAWPPLPPAASRRQVTGLCLRRFRPPFPADLELRNGRPVFISALKVSGPIVNARGPWHASGQWWDERRWVRQEWDVETRDGSIYRLFHADNDWFVEGVYD